MKEVQQGVVPQVAMCTLTSWHTKPHGCTFPKLSLQVLTLTTQILHGVTWSCKIKFACGLSSQQKAHGSGGSSMQDNMGPAAGCCCEVQSSPGYDTEQAISCTRKHRPAASCWCDMQSSAEHDKNQAISGARKHGPAGGCWCEVQSSAGHDTGQAVSCVP